LLHESGWIPVSATLARLKNVTDAVWDVLCERRLLWWQAFWEKAFLDLCGDERVEFLTRVWYANLYSYASVAPVGLPPKFNGGAGLIFRDARVWGQCQ